MLFSQINPHIRYAKYLNISDTFYADELVALDVRLFYTVKGYGKIKVDSSEYEMSEHSLLIINSGVPYKILKAENANYIQINFDYTQKASSFVLPVVPILKTRFKEGMLLDSNTFEDFKELSQIFYIRKIDCIHNKLTTIVSEYMQKLLFYRQKSGHMLADCIAESLRYTHAGIAPVHNAEQNSLLSYIHSHLKENLSNTSIGKQFGYHPNYVGFLVKKLTGIPLHRYIIRIRLENAANLLVETELSVGEIAAATGFCDTAYFSGCFKKQFGVSPSGYRNA